MTDLQHHPDTPQLPAAWIGTERGHWLRADTIIRVEVRHQDTRVEADRWATSVVSAPWTERWPDVISRHIDEADAGAAADDLVRLLAVIPPSPTVGGWSVRG